MVGFCRTINLVCHFYFPIRKLEEEKLEKALLTQNKLEKEHHDRAQKMVEKTHEVNVGLYSPGIHYYW